MNTPAEAEAYYQDQYTPEYPQVRLPSPGELRELIQKNFAGTPLDLGPKIQVLKAVRPTGRVLDYGCSWGYGTYQLAQHGFQAIGFEIAKPRARYARQRLGVEVIDRLDDLEALPASSFDIVFSNHVLEHLTAIKDALNLTARLLVPVGLAFHILPNFTGATARGGMWLKWIGEEHPLAPTIEFFGQNLPKHGFGRIRFGSSPFDDTLAAGLVHDGEKPLQTEGDELLLLASRI